MNKCLRILTIYNKLTTPHNTWLHFVISDEENKLFGKKLIDY